MATPTVLPTEGLIANPAALQRALDWSKVLDAPVGRKRFQAVRGMLREFLQETSRAPSSVKKFLSESLVTSVGPSGRASKLPRELRRILGSSADDFAKEVQTGYYFLTGKAPGGPTNAAFKNILRAMEKAGMPAKEIAILRKMGPAKLIKMGGPARAIVAMSEAQKDPAFLRVINWAGRKLTGKAATAGSSIPVPLVEAASKFKPTAATYSELGGAGVKGLGKVARAVRGIGVLPVVAAGATAYHFASTISDVNAEQDRATQMAKTGIISDELGGPAIVAHDAKGGPITAGQFLQMMRDRQDQMKVARFNAATQEADLTRDVLSYISGADEKEQRQVQRIRLGSARPPGLSRPQRSVDAGMKQFDALLRQATAGQMAPEPGT